MELTENSTLIVLVLSLFALLLLLIKMFRGDKRYKLEKDSSGLWRYHKETQFLRKAAYQKKIGQKDKSKEKKKPIAVIKFEGDIKAKQHKILAKFVDEVEVNKDELDEIVVVVSSPGGAVPGYGHAYAQIERIRNLDLKLTVCIDVVAASGGYLMSVPADKIIAAPFALVGSVGVVAFVPNLHRLLTKNDITPRTFTAGKYKRTVSLFNEDTKEEEQHFQSQLEAIHRLFVEAVKKYRSQLNLAEVETGDHWTAQESIEKNLGLVDEIGTSHDYLLKKNLERDVVYLNTKKNFWDDGVGRFTSSLADNVEERVTSWLQR